MSIAFPIIVWIASSNAGLNDLYWEITRIPVEEAEDAEIAILPRHDEEYPEAVVLLSQPMFGYRDAIIRQIPQLLSAFAGIALISGGFIAILRGLKRKRPRFKWESRLLQPPFVGAALIVVGLALIVVPVGIGIDPATRAWWKWTHGFVRPGEYCRVLRIDPVDGSADQLTVFFQESFFVRRSLAIACESNTLYVSTPEGLSRWDLSADGDLVERLTPYLFPQDIALSRDQQRLFRLSGESITQVDLDSPHRDEADVGEVEAFLRNYEPLDGPRMFFLRSGRLVALSSRQCLKVWDTRSECGATLIDEITIDPPVRVAASHDRIASIRRRSSFADPVVVDVFSFQGPRSTRTVSFDLPALLLADVKYSGDTLYLLVRGVGIPSFILKLDLQTGQATHTYLASGILPFAFDVHAADRQTIFAVVGMDWDRQPLVAISKDTGDDDNVWQPASRATLKDIGP